MATVKLDHHKLLLLITFNCSFSCSVTPLGISRHLFSYQQQRMEVLWRNKAFALKVKWRHRVDILSPGFCSRLAWPGKSLRPLFKKTSKLKLREKKRFKTKRRRQPGFLVFFIKNGKRLDHSGRAHSCRTKLLTLGVRILLGFFLFYILSVVPHEGAMLLIFL